MGVVELKHTYITSFFLSQVVATLSDWLGEGKIKSSEFEKDKRFIRICQVLGNNIMRNKVGLDLSMVLNVANDDEAAKQISGISHEQRIKVKLYFF